VLLQLGACRLGGLPEAVGEPHVARGYGLASRMLTSTSSGNRVRR
jgi:hypothetical protein